MRVPEAERPRLLVHEPQEALPRAAGRTRRAQPRCRSRTRAAGRSRASTRARARRPEALPVRDARRLSRHATMSFGRRSLHRHECGHDLRRRRDRPAHVLPLRPEDPPSACIDDDRRRRLDLRALDLRGAAGGSTHYESRKTGDDEANARARRTSVASGHEGLARRCGRHDPFADGDDAGGRRRARQRARRLRGRNRRRGRDSVRGHPRLASGDCRRPRGQARRRLLRRRSRRRHAWPRPPLRGSAPAKVVFGIRVLGLLGIRTLVLTNAVGAIDDSLRPGQLVLISDHINLQAQSPLVGPNDESLGPRFPDMSDAYDPELRAAAKAAAEPARPRARRGRVRSLARPGVRDAGRDPHAAHARRGHRRHVHRARGARRAAHGYPLPRRSRASRIWPRGSRPSPSTTSRCSRSVHAPPTRSSRSCASSFLHFQREAERAAVGRRAAARPASRRGAARAGRGGRSHRARPSPRGDPRRPRSR